MTEFSSETRYKKKPKMETRQVSNKKILSIRTDGMGARLCAMINGIVIADLLSYDFGFLWPPSARKYDDKLFGDDHRQQIQNQSTSASDEMFSEAFMKAYSVSDIDRSNFKPMTGYHQTMDDLRANEESADFCGWISDYNHLAKSLSSEALAECEISYKDAFERIDFSPKIQVALDLADGIEVEPNFTAIHMRAGDIVFGRWRKSGYFAEKVISIPVVKEIVRLGLSDGQKFVVFGQDRKALGYLASKYGIGSASAYSENFDFSPAQQAMFEIKLASRAERIVGAGSPTTNNDSFGSGFARIASMIGGCDHECQFHYLEVKQHTTVILDDLEKNGEVYHPLQSAYAYWQAFFYGRHNRADELSIDILTRARQFDVENPLYPLIVAALNFRLGKLDDGEETLNLYYKLMKNVHVEPKEATLQIYNGNPNQLNQLEEYFFAIEEAAAQGAQTAAKCVGYLSQVRSS